MQESKKKVYSTGSHSEKVPDPVKYVSSLTASYKLVNKLYSDQQNPADIIRSYYDSPNGLSEESKNGDKNQKSGFLGKRISTVNSNSNANAGFKYCDPATGAYYNTLEEFKKIRTVKDLDTCDLIEKELQFLGAFMMQKKKRFSSILSENFE